MSAGRYTSRVFVIGSAIQSALDAATFPAHPVTGLQPVVEFSDEDPTQGAEKIVIQLNEDVSATRDWKRASPAGRDETIGFDVTFRTFVPNTKTSSDVWDRLADVTPVIEGIIYDTVTETVVPFGYDGEVLTGIASVVPAVAPSGDGWFGAVTVTFVSLANI